MSEFVHMNPKIRDVWAAALVSGEYRRNKHRLKAPDGSFCPLGVLCDLYVRETGEGSWGTKPSLKRGLAFILPSGSTHYVYPPPEVLAWAGMSDHEFGRYRDTIKGIISGKNDVDKLDFPQMADWLRTNL